MAPDSRRAGGARIADIRSYAAEKYHGQENIDRWHRVLEAFGVESFDNLEPTTATESQTYADRGWGRWIPVVVALEKIASVD